MTDKENGEPQEFANIYLKEKIDNQSYGTTTASDGSFYIRIDKGPPFTLVISHLGYKTKEIRIRDRITNELPVSLDRSNLQLNVVVVQSSKISEEVLRSPITIEQIGIKDIQFVPSFDFYDALAGMKDVEIATQSMQFKSVNSRGFNSTSNTRFIQLIDGMDNQAPGFGFPVGNFTGLSELDAESAELLPGPSTSRYANAFNGLLFMKSRDPFLFEGISSYIKFAANNFPKSSIGFFDLLATPVYEFALRYAKVFKERFAFKTNITIIKASDWEASNFDNIGEGERFGRHFGTFPVPGYDGINVYGDEVKAQLPIGFNGTNVTVTRTGYQEPDLFDYNFTNFKIDGALHYKIKPDITAVVQGKSRNRQYLFHR